VNVRKGVALALAALAAYVLVSWLVVTDRERVERVLDEMRAAAVRGDWEAVASHVDDDVSAGAPSKASLVDEWRTRWRSFALKRVDLDVGDVDVSGDRAAARVRVFPGAPLEGHWADARVHLVRRDDAWRVTGVDEVRPGVGFWSR
jgi:hypothetical protein